MAADKDKHTDRHETEALSSTAVDDSLDEYGVWVKSGPEDVSDDETGDSETISDLQEDDVPGSGDIDSENLKPITDEIPSGSDASEDDMAPASSISDYPESMDLSEEEEALLADLEDSDSNIEAPDSSETAGDETNEGDLEQDSGFSMSDDSVSDDAETLYDLELPSELDLSDEIDLTDEDVDTGRLEQDDTSSESGDDALPDLEFPDEETFTMDLPDDEGSGLEIPTDESSPQDETSSDSTTSDSTTSESEEEFENDLEISFEEETSEEDSESDIHFEYAENVEDLPDLELEDDTESTAAFATEPPNYGDVQEMTTGASDTEENTANAPVTEISLEEVTDDNFDDVDAVAGQMAEPLAQESEEPGNATAGESSKQAFQLIQNELASIKSELAGLKEELNDLRGSGSAASQPAPSEALDLPPSEPDTGYEDAQETEELFDAQRVESETPESEIQESDESLQAGDGGFFEEDEDEDETIALTGDELDNILNTAEFIQEQGQPTDFEDSELDLDLSSLEEEEQTGEYGAAAEAADEFDELADEDFAFDLPDSGAETPETSEADATTETETGSRDQPAIEQSAQGSEPFGASHEEVDALANMDIDTELADIDELDDTSGFAPEADNLQGTDEAASEPELQQEPEFPPESEIEAGFELEPETESAEPEGEQSFTEAPVEESVATDFAGEAAGSSETPAVDQGTHGTEAADELPEGLKEEIRSVLSYMDQLLESLPEDKIKEFANSEHFEVYKRLFEELELEP